MISLVGLVLYLFLEILRPEVVLPEPIANFAMPVVAVATALAFAVESIGRTWRSASSTKFLAGFLVIATLSTVFILRSEQPFSGIFELAKISLMYAVATQAIRTEGRLKTVQRILTALVILLAVEGVLFSLGNRMPGFSGDRQQRLQYSGIFADSNDLSQLYAVGWTLVFFDLVNGKNRMLKLLEAPVLLCLSAAIMYGESRGAILGVLLGMVLTLSKRIGIIVPGALALVVLAGMNIAAVGRMDRLSSGESSAEGRLKSWAQGWYMLRSHPLLGVGPRKFHDHHRVAPHSSVVQVAAETGIPGLFCWIGFFFLAIREPLANVIPWGKTIFRARSPAPPPSNQTSQLAIAQIVCFFTGLFLSRAYVLLPYFLTALAIAARNLDLYKDGQAPAAVPFLDRDVQHVAIVFCATMIAWRFIIRAYVFGP